MIQAQYKDSIFKDGLSDKQIREIAIAWWTQHSPANSYNAVIAFREAAANSTRISGADVESISESGSGFQAIVVLGFKPGQAR